MERTASIPALRVAGLYVLIGVLWILFSDVLVAITAPEPVMLTQLQTYKGWAFVVASGLLIFLLLKRELGRRLDAEQTLRESERMMKSILAASPVAIGLTENRKVKWVNRSWEEIFGFENRKYLDQEASIVYPSQDEYERVGKELYPSLGLGHVTRTDARFMRQDGSIFDGHIRMKALDPSDPAKGTIAAIMDVSDKKKAVEALRVSEEKYRQVVEKAQEGILVAQDGLLRFVNPKIVELLGYSEEEVTSKPFAEFIHPDDREMVVEKHRRRMRGEKFPTRYSFKVLTKEGTTKIVEIDSTSIFWEERPAALVLMTDITERLRMEEQLKEREEWYRTLVEESFDGMFVQQGATITFANAQLHKMLGYASGELKGMEHWRVYHPDYHALTRERANARMRGDEAVSQYEVVLQRKDGTSFDGEISARAVTVRGKPGVQVWLRDISKRKRSELALRRLATAVGQAEETIVITDPSGNIEYVNPAFERITGFTRDEVLGQNSRILKSGEHDESFYRNLWLTITHGRVWKGRLVNRRKDGTLYSEDATISPVRDPTGRIVNFVAVKRDVTEQLALQQQLMQAQKMEAVGTLAGGIAHDFNNLLQVTLGYSELLLADKSEDDSHYADLQKIHQAARSGAELVQRLLTFSKKVEFKPVPLDINRQIERVERLLRRTIPRMIDIRLELSPDVERVKADPAQIEQIIMNLALNARDAMGESGLLVIGTENVELDDDYCRLRSGFKPGSYVLLSVSDTGHGIDRDTLQHIFEPFYTTKELGRGTGLGLAMVYGIVKQHEGHITCHSEVGKGTNFKIYLPSILKEPEAVDVSAEMPAFGTETLLLVDDESAVRELGERILTKNGYEVISVGSALEALDVFSQQGEKISLVILDLVMPSVGGKDCLSELLKINPKAKVLIASGYLTDAVILETLNYGAKGFVAKPFRVKELLIQVRKVLDGS